MGTDWTAFTHHECKTNEISLGVLRDEAAALVAATFENSPTYMKFTVSRGRCPGGMFTTVQWADEGQELKDVCGMLLSVLATEAGPVWAGESA